MGKLIIGGIILILAIGLMIGCGSDGGGATPTETIEKFIDAVNKRNFQEANKYLADGEKLNDNDAIVRYIGKIQKVAILNEEITSEGAVSGVKTARAHVVINPPSTMPLRGKFGQVVAGVMVYGEPSIKGGVPITSPKNYFIYNLRWQDGRWRIVNLGLQQFSGWTDIEKK